MWTNRNSYYHVNHNETSAEYSSYADHDIENKKIRNYAGNSVRKLYHGPNHHFEERVNEFTELADSTSYKVWFLIAFFIEVVLV